MRLQLLIPTLLLAMAVASFAQPLTPPVATPVTQASAVSQVDIYVKIGAAIVTGIATLLGLPIVFLTYRKTRAEIAKLELEARALREKQAESPNQTKDEEGNIRIVVDRSPYTSIHVLADPRFLAPLLILLDFIFAWIVLTIAGHLLSIFGFGALRNLALTVLAASLLLPIARQVMRVRSVLRPPRTPEEVSASQRQLRLTAFAIYATCVLSSLLFGALFLNVSPGSLTKFGRYLAWTLIGLGVLMIALAPVAKTRLDRYLTRMQQSQIK